MPGSRANRIRSVLQWTLVVGFLAAIWLPLMDSALGLGPASNFGERRTLAPWPEINWRLEEIRALPDALEAYYDDHFGFRDSLVQLNSWLRWLLVSNPFDTQVVVGKSGWLFLNVGGGLLDDFRAVRRYTDAELERIRHGLVERRDQVAELGARYLLVVAPEKQTIYPEMVPARVRRAAEPARLGQLFDYLRATTDLEIVDLRGPLTEAKALGPVYQSTGTHWTDLGAYVASVEIRRQVIGDRLKKPLGRFRIQGARTGSNDLARMLGLKQWLREDSVRLRFRRRMRAQLTVKGLADLPTRMKYSGRYRHPKTIHRLRFAHEVDDPSLPRAVMFRDSFATAMVPFLGEYFQRIGYYRIPFLVDVVRQQSPDVVIEERSERTVTQLTWLQNLQDQHQ